MSETIHDHRQELRESDRRKILVISTTDRLSSELREHAVHLSERLDCDLLVLSIGSPWDQAAFWRRAERNVRDLQRKAALVGVQCEHTVKFGAIGPAIDEVRSQARRIAFVVADVEVGRAKSLLEFTVPVFTVSPTHEPEKGGGIMSANPSSRRSLAAKTAAYGLLSAGLYTLVFMNADTVMSSFMRGGLYAALPIATVFAFSFAHGAFASHLWSLLGIEAVRRDALRQTEKKVVPSRKRAQKRARAYAYVNPFHRM